MKTRAFETYLYTADYYNFELVGAGDAADVEHYYEKVINFSANMTNASNSLIVATKEPLRVGARIDNIKTRYGVQVFPFEGFPEGYSFVVMSAIPNLNPFGTVEGYRHNMTRG